MRRVRAALLVVAVVALALGRGGVAQADTPADSARGARAPHPEPRVIIDATAKRAADASAIQAAARRGFWGRAVGCYKPAVAEDPKLVIDASFDVEVRGGVVHRASARKRGGKRGGGTKQGGERVPRGREVAGCIAKRLVGLAMPEDVRGGAVVRVRIAPGDPAP